MSNVSNGVVKKGQMQTYLGKMTTYMRDGESIMRGTTPTQINNPQTAVQMYHRLRLPNMVAFYRVVRKFNQKGWENLPPKTSLYNCFVGANMDIEPLGIRKEDFKAGMTIVEAYQITSGSLPAIEVDTLSEGAAKGITNIVVGDMSISETTEVGALAQAIVEQNGGAYQYGDEIAFLLAEQYYVDGIARVRAKRIAISLTKDSDIVLGDIDMTGWGVKDGKLAINGVAPLGGYCWVHSRKDEEGNLRVSTQRMITVGDSLQKAYRDPEQMRQAAEDQGADFSEIAFLECHTAEEAKAISAFGIIYKMVRKGSDGDAISPSIASVQYGAKDIANNTRGIVLKAATQPTLSVSVANIRLLGADDVSLSVNDVACTEVHVTENTVEGKLDSSLNGKMLESVEVASGSKKAMAKFK